MTMSIQYEKHRLCFCMSFQTRVLIFAVANVIVTGVQLILPLTSSGIMLYLNFMNQSEESTFMLNQQSMRIFGKPPSLSNEIMVNEPDVTKSDAHIWATWLMMKFTLFCFSWVLYTGARLESYNRCLSWLTMQVPMVAHSLMTLSMDVGMKTILMKSFQKQIMQYAELTFGFIGLLIVYMFMGKIGTRIQRRVDEDIRNFSSPVKIS